MSNPRPIRLKVASPCKVPWSSMTGDDAIRYCGTCEKQVYNLSAMTTEQTEVLLAAPGGRPCVRFFQRTDGTVMTADCPVGAQRVRRQRIAVGVGAGLLSALGYGAMPGGPTAAETIDMPPEHAAPAHGAFGPTAPHAVLGPPPPALIEVMGGAPVPVEEVMGKMALPDEVVELQGDVAVE